MSALCAFPPLIPAGGGGGGGVYSAGYMADVSSSNSNRSSSFSAYSNAMATSQQSRISSASIPAYGSTFGAFHQQPTTAVGAGKSTVMKMTQPESAWSSRTTSSTTVDVPPAAKRRCTDKMRSTTAAVWSDQHAQIWPSSASSIPASVCPSGCTMCHLQRQQQQQQQQQQHYPSLNGFQQAYDCRRPLQEKHQNREESLVASNMAAVGHLKSAMKSADTTTTVRMPNVNRSLSVDPKKDYSAPLHVDCSVEYDLPRIVRPPPGAQPLLILAPPRPSAVPLATPTGYQTWTTTANSLSHPPQWNHQQQGVGTRIKSDKPSAASVKSHPAAMQQQKLNSTISGAIRNNSAGGGGVPCGCPSCCLAARPNLPPNVYAGPTGVGGGAGWMNQHWSPPAGATASSAGFNYAPPQQQQQQQQQQQPTYQMAAFHNIDQQPQQPQTVINRRRKRSPEVIPSSGGGMSTTSDKMQRLYSTAQWMPNPSSIQAAAEAAFVAAAAAAAAAASHRYVTSSPAWMHASAQPLKFHC